MAVRSGDCQEESTGSGAQDKGGRTQATSTFQLPHYNDCCVVSAFLAYTQKRRQKQEFWGSYRVSQGHTIVSAVQDPPLISHLLLAISHHTQERQDWAVVTGADTIVVRDWRTPLGVLSEPAQPVQLV